MVDWWGRFRGFGAAAQREGRRRIYNSRGRHRCEYCGRSRIYGDLAKELRAFADVADAWLETLPNRPRRLQRDESGEQADEGPDDGEEGAA